VVKGAIASGVRRFYEFGLFRLDPIRRRLSCDGKFVPLYPKAVEALIILVEHCGKILEREALMNALWPHMIVEESNLTVAISHLRKALNGNSDAAEFIQTIPRVGYRFVADVREIVEEPISLIGDENRPHTHVEIDHACENGASASESESQRRLAIIAPSPIAPSPRSVKTRWLFAGIILAIGIVGVGVFSFVRYRNLLAAVQAPSSSAANLPRNATQMRGYSTYETAQIPEKSIAVLPFENLSDDKQNAYFAAGVQDEILSDLARIIDLKVISRTSANLYKSGNPRNSREVGQQLGVAHLLEGSVQRIGDRLRVHAQLIDARTDTHVWAQTYDRAVADLFAVQSEIAQTIADQLHASISTDERLAIAQPPTADLNAFALYSHAKDLIQGWNYSPDGKATLLEAADLLSRAVARDPKFFQAYCQLAWIHDQVYNASFDRTRERLALAQAAIDVAFRLRPDAGEAHLARAGHLYRGYRDFDRAFAELEIAQKTLHNDPKLFELKGYIERRQGRWENAVQNLQRAIDLDPRNALTLQQTASCYNALRRYADEEAILDRMLALKPNDPNLKVSRAFVEFDWKADTRPLNQMIEEIRAQEPAAIQGVADSWLTCTLAERDPVATANALATLGKDGIGDEVVKLSPRFLEGLIARMTKDFDKARAAFTAAREAQEKIVSARPGDAGALCVLGLIDAALGRNEDALREGRRAVEILPIGKDALTGARMVTCLAMIAAWVGNKELACEQLAVALRYPNAPSYGHLKLLPFWDPLRGDPRFEAIVASRAPK
jgi:TolB-like protein/DNA-binding winged helix-turn-helix (wHTH) protein/Tfp pilus assembly protein PilF